MSKFLQVQAKTFKELGVSTHKELWDNVKEQYKGLSMSVATEFKQKNENENMFEVTMSTETPDRHGDVVKQSWELKNFKENPVLLDSHNYDSIEHILGRVNSARVRDGKLVGKVEFNLDSPKGMLGFQMASKGFLNTTSVGFIPKDFDDDGNITKSELLELSAVSVPANPEAQFERMFKIAKTIPNNVSDQLADKETEWSAPTLNDFTEQEWEELPDDEKNRIAGHFAYRPSGSIGEVNFSDLKLPHHRASDGAVVFNGVVAAMAALNGARGGTEGLTEDDRQAVHSHLSNHYRQFDEEPPELKALDSEQADEEETDEEKNFQNESVIDTIEREVGELEEKQMSDEEIAEVFDKYMDTVNMTATELENWADTDCSKLASQNRDPIERNLRLLRKNKSNWTEKNANEAKKTISFVSRMKEVERGEPVNENCPSKRDIALKNWAVDPDKKSLKIIELADIEKSKETAEQKRERLLKEANEIVRDMATSEGRSSSQRKYNRAIKKLLQSKKLD